MLDKNKMLDTDDSVWTDSDVVEITDILIPVDKRVTDAIKQSRIELCNTCIHKITKSVTSLCSLNTCCILPVLQVSAETSCSINKW